MTRVALSALVLLLACTPPPAVATKRAEIPALRCSLDVPAGTEVMLDDDGATFVLEPGTRAPHSFSLHARAPAQRGELRQVLAADVSIAYALEANDGGSGGSESTLVGSLQVGSSEFAVKCHDQDEWPGDPDASWCLTWLATIRVDR
ncbi:hypothetical protein OV203_45315 [Nannocystis sp. ILAH1]|uniref:hypothetical protein n=1 Tax=Nannocystis sp. ILAH1 TaxID=2996789 RepID=UPI00226F04C6|nr:hypothetical protein [Nannocystis sp. ILAH1]MCY0994428.1 hypothetical protein [Nannocystis sp. ILAH1]